MKFKFPQIGHGAFLLAIVLSLSLYSVASFAADKNPTLWTDPTMGMFGMVCNSAMVKPTFDGISSYADALRLQVAQQLNESPSEGLSARHKTWIGRFDDGGVFTLSAEEFIDKSSIGNICAVTGVVKDPEAFKATVIEYMKLTKEPAVSPFEQTGKEYTWASGLEFGRAFKLGIKKLEDGKYGVKVGYWERKKK